jgi:formate dehydrogenase maturation protein FdhE
MRSSYLILILALMASGGFVLSAQDPPQSPAEDRDMMARCQQMMSQRGEMRQRMEAMDKKLDALVAEMNQTKGGGKVDAIVKVVNEMAAQRKDMRQMMLTNDGMMSHMMEHMQAGSAAMCPMMQEMMQGMMKGMMQGMDNAPKK